MAGSLGKYSNPADVRMSCNDPNPQAGRRVLSDSPQVGRCVLSNSPIPRQGGVSPICVLSNEVCPV